MGALDCELVALLEPLLEAESSESPESDGVWIGFGGKVEIRLGPNVVDGRDGDGKEGEGRESASPKCSSSSLERYDRMETGGEAGNDSGKSGGVGTLDKTPVSDGLLGR